MVRDVLFCNRWPARVLHSGSYESGWVSMLHECQKRINTNRNNLLSSSVIGFYLSYIVPILLRITSGRDKFKPGPFNLGSWSITIGTIACSWSTFICVLLMFPSVGHPNSKTMSGYDPVSVHSSDTRQIMRWCSLWESSAWLVLGGS